MTASFFIFSVFLAIYGIKKTPLSAFMAMVFLFFFLIEESLIPEMAKNSPEIIMVVYASLNFFGFLVMFAMRYFWLMGLFILNILLCLQIQIEYTAEVYVFYGLPYFLLYYALCVMEAAAVWNDGNLGRVFRCIRDFFSAYNFNRINSTRNH